MPTLLIVLLFLLGVVLIVKGGDAFVDAASWIAEAFHIPKFIVGATIVSLATTLPELLVSAIAASQGKTEMAIGNAVGSVTANIGLIMGISIFCMPSVMKRSSFAFKGLLMVFAAGLLYALSFGGELLFGQSFLLLAVFAVFLLANLWDAKCAIGTASRDSRPEGGLALNLAKFALGTAGIVLGAQLLVDNGSALARMLGIPEGIIGVTMIAVGTSLPELVTTLTAIAKRQASLSIGNIIGANIIDLTLILPISAWIAQGSLPISAQALRLDFPACLLVCLLAIVPPLQSGRFRRWQGLLLLACYGAYLALLCTSFL